MHIMKKMAITSHTAQAEGDEDGILFIVSQLMKQCFHSILCLLITAYIDNEYYCRIYNTEP